MKYHCPLLPDHIYHVFNHAVGNENLYRETANYQYFLDLAVKHIIPVMDVYAYCLLPNHFHFLIRVKDIHQLIQSYTIQKEKEPPFDTDWSKYVMQQFSNFCNAYTKAYNKRYNRRGALFLDYLKRSQIYGVEYFCNCVHYIHYNAVYHGLCGKIEDWYWTSFHTMLRVAPSKIDRSVVIKTFEGKHQFLSFHSGKPKISGDELEFI
ncbi:MAG: hypothetical protein IPM26_07460 [Saprospiraceae bacterium]|nr:hypothetical protein [Saprospiraceae bacterium]